MKELRVIIKHRVNEAIVWYNINPILAEGEIGIESDTGKFKYGNGTSPWRELEYAYGSGVVQIMVESIDDLPPAENYPGCIAIVPRHYTNVPIIGTDGKPTEETENFTMDTPYLSLRKNGAYYWTVFSDQKDQPIASSLLDYFQLDVSILG